MERTIKSKIPAVEAPIKQAPVVEEAVVETKLRWKKIGGGSLYWHNKIIKPGETFFADIEELPKSFMDTLICLDTADLQKVKAEQRIEMETLEVLYHVEKASKGKFNVVNNEGKPINEKPLAKEAAEELLVALS